MASVSRLATAKGLRQALTLHVYQKNADAKRFYLREGFWVQSTQIDPYTGEMECEMRWENYKKHGQKSVFSFIQKGPVRQTGCANVFWPCRYW